MATATASNTAPTAPGGQGTDDNYTASNMAGEPSTADAPSTGDGGGNASHSEAESPAAPAAADENCISDPLRAERRRTNQLEKEIRTLKQQLNRFSEINPEEYARLQEAERQKQVLE